MSEESPQTHDVFISYSTKNKKWADAACAMLERNGIRCWIAPRDIMPGVEWGAAIIGGIDASRLVLLIFSSDANDSPQVRREVERAVSKGLAILPFRIEDVAPAGAMEYALGNTHWLDGFTPPLERHLDALAKSVAALLNQNSDPNSGAAPNPGALEDLVGPPSSAPLTRSQILIAASVAVVAVIAAVAFVMTRGQADRDHLPASADAETKPGPTAEATSGPRSFAAAFFADGDRRFNGSALIGRTRERTGLAIQDIREENGGRTGSFQGEMGWGARPDFGKFKISGEWNGNSVKMKSVEVTEGHPPFPIEFTGVVVRGRLHGTFQAPQGNRSGTFDLKADTRGTAGVVKKKTISPSGTFDLKSDRIRKGE